MSIGNLADVQIKQIIEMRLGYNPGLKQRKSPDVCSIMRQDWNHLLFLHWEYDREEIQQSLPEGLFVDTFDGKGYITIVPFFLENLKFGNFLYIPGFSNFIEVNVRTYVYDKQGIPGIWFYSLDIDSFIITKAAHIAFSLPYFFAKIKREYFNQNIIIEGYRLQEPKAKMKFSYRPLETSPTLAENESLEFFLIERYVLFSLKSKQLHYQRVHHQPYPLKDVFVDEYHNTLLQTHGFFVSKPPDFIHYSPGVNVTIFNMKSIEP